MKNRQKPVLIDIQTKAGTLQAVPAHALKPKHLKRMKTILDTIESKKKRKAVQKDLIGELFYKKAPASLMDKSLYLTLTWKQRNKVIKHWWKASNAIHDMEKILEDFSVEGS